MDAEVLPATALPIPGAPGIVAGVTLFESRESTPVPTALVATTRQVTGTPLARPVTVIGDPVPLPLCVPQVAV